MNTSCTVKGLLFPKQKQIEILLEILSLVNQDKLVLTGAVMGFTGVSITGELKES